MFQARDDNKRGGSQGAASCTEEVAFSGGGRGCSVLQKGHADGNLYGLLLPRRINVAQINWNEGRNSFPFPSSPKDYAVKWNNEDAFLCRILCGAGAGA